MERLTVDGKLDSLEAIAQYVKAATAKAGLDKKASYRLRQAVDEIATNIICHGYEAAGREGVLDLWADIDQKVLKIYIEDTGVTYDPRQTPTPKDKELRSPLDKRHIGGLGVYLALGSVDEFLYERVGTRNRNIFIVHLN
ncbi:MAG: ATP-binding protein [Rhizonema sp. NSF051]|nr:ATP-binding protein [Rhizonema sp. NSF051]